jgi:hypothetical protein
MKAYVHFGNTSLNSFKNEKCFTRKSTENHNIFYVQWLFFRKLCRLYDNVEKYGTARQDTDGNI